jgi:hypothetical protein
MTRRTQVALVLVAAIALGVLAAFLLLRRDDGEDLAFSSMTNRGRPLEMAVPESAGAGAKFTGEAILLAERGGVRFLRLPRADGTSCWSTGERRSGVWSLTGYSCETGFLRFPDRERPVMVVGRLLLAPPTQLMAYDSFAGFAADGVARIGVMDGNDRVIEVTEVVDNVFFTPDPPEEVKAVVALDAAGEVIWRGLGAQQPAE